jgi:hypothetical protein
LHSTDAGGAVLQHLAFEFFLIELAKHGRIRLHEQQSDKADDHRDGCSLTQWKDTMSPNSSPIGTGMWVARILSGIGMLPESRDARSDESTGCNSNDRAGFAAGALSSRQNTGAKKKVMVMGAGIAGLPCAYELARRGHDVVPNPLLI